MAGHWAGGVGVVGVVVGALLVVCNCLLPRCVHWNWACSPLHFHVWCISIQPDHVSSPVRELLVHFGHSRSLDNLDGRSLSGAWVKHLGRIRSEDVCATLLA